MSIYHCSIKIIGRTGGRSAVASAAYRSGERLYNEETGMVHDFTRKGGVVYSAVLLPKNAPDQYKDRQTLWNEVQKVEKRNDAQFAREVEVAFPVEMNREEQISCLQTYVTKNFVSKGMIADVAIHDKRDGNPHAHILLTVRAFDEQKRWSKKQKTVFANARDKEGRPIYDPSLPSYDPKDKEHTAKYRIPVLDKDGNQKTRIRKGKGTEYLWERISIPLTDWNEHTKAEEWRASWAEECNRYLSLDQQINHRSFKRQGIDLEPSIHEGVAARQMEARGLTSERCQMNQEIREMNSLRQEIWKLAGEITQIITEKAKEIYERIRKLRGNTGDSHKTGRNGISYGAAAGGKGESGGRKRGSDAANWRDGITEPKTVRGDFGIQFEESQPDGTAGRIHAVKRAAAVTEQEIAETDRGIEELKQQIKRREAERNDRIRKLMERRAASNGNGENAGPDRFSDRREGRMETGSLTGTADDIRAFLADLAAKERTAEKRREDREAERGRFSLKKERESGERKPGIDHEGRKSKKRSRSYGPEL